MKKIMLAVGLMFGAATLVSAQEQQDQATTPSQTETTLEQDQDRQQIAVSELPENVTAKLESQDYTGWTVGNAYKKTDEAQNEIYIIELRQGTETKKVKFDSDGNELKKGDMEHKDKADDTNYKSEDSSPEDADATEQDATDQADNAEVQPDQK